MSSTLTLNIARAFKPLLYPSRYKGAHGGRGSGKSHVFAELLVLACLQHKGHRVLCGREVQKSLKESAKRLVEDKIEQLKAPGFRVMQDRIETPGGGVIIFQGLAEHTVESVKSFEGFDKFWCEEANRLSQRSLDLIRPTLRKAGSELWFSWNPFRKSDPVDALLRGPAAKELGAVVVQANWRDNPWFPGVLQDERRFDEAHSPETYQHVWEGQYASVVKGAYYANCLAEARQQGRICNVPIDPMLEIRTWWDLGVEDSMAIWVGQCSARAVAVLDYIEGQGQPLSYYVNELRARGYGNSLCVLPHDGARRDSVTAIKFEDHLKDAGFRVRTVANQGKGAAMLRIEAARRMFPRIWFNEATTVSGREALGAYHEKRDDNRQVGLGPLHDWSSHASDSFGLMCVASEGPKHMKAKPAERFSIQLGQGGSTSDSGGWLGS